MDGDEIKWRNEYMPKYPGKMPLWQRILCVLGYHKRETRKCGPRGSFPGMKLRDQCGRCGTLL